MTTALIAASLLFGLVGLVLVVPVHVNVTLRLDDTAHRAQADVRVRWLFVKWEAGRRARAARVRPARRRGPEHPRRSVRRTWRQVRAVVGTAGFIRRVLRLVAEIVRTFRPARVDVWMRIGFDDPAETGACAGVVAAIIPAAWRDHIAIETDFCSAALEGQADIAWRIRLAALLGPFGRFAVSPVTWRAGWAAVRAR